MEYVSVEIMKLDLHSAPILNLAPFYKKLAQFAVALATWMFFH